MRIKKVFSLQKAIQLVNMGNKIIFTEDNWKNRRLKVFCFEDNEKLKEDWDKLITE